MFSYKSPKSIPGLKLWWDASDPSTVNDGWVLQNQNVYKFVDKISGSVLVNTNGTSGPSYSFFSVNGKNSIHFPSYTETNGTLKALTGTLTGLSSTLSKTIFFVFKPTTNNYGNNRRYALSLWEPSYLGGLNKEPSISVRSGGGTNPYSEYGETQNTAQNLLLLRNEKSFQHGLRTSTNPDLSTLQIIGVKSGLRTTNSGRRTTKFISLQEKGFDSKFEYYNTNSLLLGENSQPTINSSMNISIGSYYYTNLDKGADLYPLEGYFCEMLFYDRYLTDDEMNSVTSYLLRKWDPIRATFSLSSIPTSTPPRISQIIVSLPSVLTGSATSTSNSAQIDNNQVTNEGNGNVSSRGVVWSTNVSPTITNGTVVNSGNGPGLYNVTITGLANNTTYYVRAFATNQAGTNYGQQISFTTTSAITLVMDTPQDLRWDDPANPVNLFGTLAGRVLNSTDQTISRGFRIYDAFNQQQNAWGLGSLISNFYATSPFFLNWRIGLGIQPGIDVNPSVNLAPATNSVTHHTVFTRLSGNNVSRSLNLFGGTFVDINFVQNNLLNYTNLSGSSEIPNLSRARLRIPIISLTLTDLTQFSNQIEINYRMSPSIDTANQTFHSRGIFYSTTSTFTTREKRTDVLKLQDPQNTNVGGSRVMILSNVSSNTTYYIRAYYSTLSGPNNDQEVVVMSGIRQLTTTAIPVLATVTTGTIQNIQSTSVFVLGSTITSAGNGTISARGVVWSTSQNPTIALSTKTSDGVGIGQFNSSPTLLSGSTLYYVRAYATNEAGTAYGNQVSFTTLSATAPAITNFAFRQPQEDTNPRPSAAFSTPPTGNDTNDCSLELGFDITNLGFGGIKSAGVWRSESSSFSNPQLTLASNLDFQVNSIQKVFREVPGRFGPLVAPQTVTPRRWYYQAFLSTEVNPTSTQTSYNSSIRSSNTLSFVFEKTWMDIGSVIWNTTTSTFTLIGNWSFSSGLSRSYGFGWVQGTSNPHQSSSVNLITIGTSNTINGSFTFNLNPGTLISVNQTISVSSWVEGDNGVKIWSLTSRSAQRTS